MCTFQPGNATGWGSEEVNTPRNATAATRGRSVPLFHPRLWALTVLLIAMSSPKIPIASQRVSEGGETSVAHSAGTISVCT